MISDMRILRILRFGWTCLSLVHVAPSPIERSRHRPNHDDDDNNGDDDDDNNDGDDDVDNNGDDDDDNNGDDDDVDGQPYPAAADSAQDRVQLDRPRIL